MASEKKIGQILSVSQIPPLDWKNPEIVASFEAAVKHCSNPDLLDIARVRTKISQIISNTLIGKGFVHPPVQLFSPCSNHTVATHPTPPPDNHSSCGGCADNSFDGSRGLKWGDLVKNSF